MRKNKFFDIIMISLILMCSFKLLYPDAFTFNVIVNGSSNSTDLEYETYSTKSEFIEQHLYMFWDTTTSDVDGYDALLQGSDVWSNSRTIEVCSMSTEKCYKLTSDSPRFYIDGELWYYFDMDSMFPVWTEGYWISTECEWICNAVYI